MRKITFTCLLLSLIFVGAKGQTEKDSAKLRMAIDSIRDGRDLRKDSRGNPDTGNLVKDTIDPKPEIPTPPTPNNPNPHDAQPSPVHPNPPVESELETQPAIIKLEDEGLG